jgi:hypothetical protein
LIIDFKGNGLILPDYNGRTFRQQVCRLQTRTVMSLLEKLLTREQHQFKSIWQFALNIFFPSGKKGVL